MCSLLEIGFDRDGLFTSHASLHSTSGSYVHYYTSSMDNLAAGGCNEQLLKKELRNSPLPSGKDLQMQVCIHDA